MSSRNNHMSSAPRKRSSRLERRSWHYKITKPIRKCKSKLSRRKADEMSSMLREKKLAEPTKDLHDRQINDSNNNNHNNHIHSRVGRLPKTTTKNAELEDGEISESDEDCSQPACPFSVLSKCIWGSKCRFRHLAATDKGNYVMFERVDLPLPRTQEYDVQMAPEFDHSFDSNLQSLRQRMHRAGYNPGDSAAGKQKDRPWVEFNDLDTDPYYTHQDEQAGSGPKDTSLLPSAYFPDPFSSIPYSQPRRRRRVNRTQILSRSSSSSTSDYSSTTNSESSCASMMPPSDYSDSSSYYSSTHSSELSSSSTHSVRSGHWRGRKKIPLKDRKYREGVQSNRKKLSRPKTMPRKGRDLGKTRKRTN